LTDASAETFAKLPKEKQQELLTAYYDTLKGIGYTLARTNVHSCIFRAIFTYVADNDSTLKSFSIDHDKKFRIPFINRLSRPPEASLLYSAAVEPAGMDEDE